MIVLLEDYINYSEKVGAASGSADTSNDQNYYMPSDAVSAEEWAQFDNVYQIHCPKVFMTIAIRDVCSHSYSLPLTNHLETQLLIQYYNCSRARRGLEYHMATRYVSFAFDWPFRWTTYSAVQFIRDQAEAALAMDMPNTSDKPRGPASTAASALRKILTGDNGPKSSVEICEETPSQPPGVVDPLNGWSDGVSVRRSHFCLLLWPQIVLRSEESVCVLAAIQAKLQSFAIMDDSNMEDPISGQVMSRWDSLYVVTSIFKTYLRCQELLIFEWAANIFANTF